MCTLAMMLATQVAAADNQHPQRPLSVMHWWVSEAERDATAIIFDTAKARGMEVNDIPTDSHRALRERVSDLLRVGHPPDFTQWIASGDLDALMLASDTILTWPRLSERVVPELRDILSVEGQMGAVPVVTHVQNSMFVNRALLARHGLDLPTDWRSFSEILRRLDEAGVKGVITSGEAWQIRMLFDDILLGVGGAEIYRAFYGIRLSDDLRQALIETFGYLFEIRNYQVSDQPAYWADVTQEFARGDIGFFFLGDFAWAVLVRSPDIRLSDFDCMIAPGHHDVLVYSTDIFIGFRTGDENKLRQQIAFGELLLDAQVQRRFAAEKGGMPVILGLDSETLAPCARFAHERWNKETTELIPTPWSYNRTALTHLETTIEEVWRNKDITPLQAAERLLDRLSTAPAQPVRR